MKIIYSDVLEIGVIYYILYERKIRECSIKEIKSVGNWAGYELEIAGIGQIWLDFEYDCKFSGEVLSGGHIDSIFAEFPEDIPNGKFLQVYFLDTCFKEHSGVLNTIFPNINFGSEKNYAYVWENGEPKIVYDVLTECSVDEFGLQTNIDDNCEFYKSEEQCLLANSDELLSSIVVF